MSNLFLIAALTCSMTLAQSFVPSPTLSLEDQLSHESIFAFGGVGYAGTTSDGEKAFRTLRTLPTTQALELSERLLKSGSPQAKAYALVELYALDRKGFRARIATVPDITVSTMQGCLMGKAKLTEIARQVEAGLFDAYLQPTRVWNGSKLLDATPAR